VNPKNKEFPFRHIAAVLLLLVPLLPAPGAPAEKRVLHGHVPAVTGRLHSLGRVPSSTRLHLAFGLPLRNRDELTNLIQRISDPKNPEFRRYLTPEQFTEKFGPTVEEYETVARFARTNGFTVSGTHPNRMLLNVSASVAEVERTFHVAIHTYRHPTEARTFHAPDAEPSIDAHVPVLNVSGFANYSRPHPASSHLRPLGAPGGVTHAGTGTGPGGTFIGNDYRAAYAPGVSLTGVGQQGEFKNGKISR